VYHAGDYVSTPSRRSAHSFVAANAEGYVNHERPNEHPAELGVVAGESAGVAFVVTSAELDGGPMVLADQDSGPGNPVHQPRGEGASAAAPDFAATQFGVKSVGKCVVNGDINRDHDLTTGWRVGL
jgi:hypothetical protein